jgi:hypothetical protein
MKDSVEMVQKEVEQHLLNMQALIPNNTISISRTISAYGSRAPFDVFVGEVHVTSFSTDHSYVSADAFYKAKHELLAFIQTGGRITRHFERYFSLWELNKPLSEAVLSRHYEAQASRQYDAHYHVGDRFTLYGKHDIFVERVCPSSGELTFTLKTRALSLAYLTGAFTKPVAHAYHVFDFDDVFPELIDVNYPPLK